MTDAERAKVVAVLERSMNGIPKKGAFVEVAMSFPFTAATVSSVWRRAVENAKATGTYTSVARIKDRSGRPKRDRSVELERLRTAPLTQRSTIWSAAAACRLSPITLYRRVQDGALRPTVSVTKPMLTDDNKEKRLRFCPDHVDRASRLFDDMYDVVHVDEKRFYLLPDEDTSYRALKNKRNITKVVFLAAVAHPRWDAATNSYFGGLLGIWPSVERRPA